MPKDQIRITCNTSLNIPYLQLNGIQGALKMMTKERFQKLRKLILANGVNFALHVWKEKVPSKKAGKSVVKWWIIDGHGRHAVIKYLVEEEGMKCDALPCVEIQADTFSQAKKLVLAASSQFHETTKEGLYEFMTDAGLTMEDLEAYEISEIEIEDFKMEFFGEPAAAGEGGEQKEAVTFDAYKNAAIKQVVLYYASEEYAKVIAALDGIVKEMALEDYSQAIWRLLSERSKSQA